MNSYSFWFQLEIRILFLQVSCSILFTICVIELILHYISYSFIYYAIENYFTRDHLSFLYLNIVNLCLSNWTLQFKPIESDAVVDEFMVDSFDFGTGIKLGSFYQLLLDVFYLQYFSRYYYEKRYYHFYELFFFLFGFNHIEHLEISQQPR